MWGEGGGGKGVGGYGRREKGGGKRVGAMEVGGEGRDCGRGEGRTFSNGTRQEPPGMSDTCSAESAHGQRKYCTLFQAAVVRNETSVRRKKK